MTDKPTIILTNAAALRLNQLSNTPQLVTGVDDLYRIGGFNEDHLADIPVAPDAPLATAPHDVIATWRTAIKAWASAKLPVITTSQRRIDSIKAMLKSAAEKGLLAGSATDRQLLRTFGLAPDDA
jgi:hypothetical protein